MSRVLLALVYSLVFHASSVMGCALLKDFTLKKLIIRAVLDAQMNLTLSHITMSVPGCSTYFISFWGHATVLPHRKYLLHDLITRVFLRSLQHGIVVMGFLDAFVSSNHQHRRIIENPWNFGDCMKRRIRFMTAITPAYAHAYQATCLARHMPAVPAPKFPPTKAQSQISVPSQ